MKVHRFGSRFHNWYIVEDGDKATVIDAGCSREWPVFVTGLTQIGLTPDDVEAVILTHGHADHVGFAGKAADQGLSVKVNTADRKRTTGEIKGTSAGVSDMPLWRPTTWRFLVTLVAAGVMRIKPVPGVETFDDGDVLDLPGRPRVAHTPGHTEGHSAFYLDDHKVLFAGDAVATMSVTGAHGPGPQMLPDKFHADLDQATASLERLVGLDTEMVYPGHGTAYKGSAANLIAAMS